MSYAALCDKQTCAMIAEEPSLNLYTYYRSSCSARVRIAANFKRIPLTYKYVHLLKGDHVSSKYVSINPSASVPTLVVKSTPNGEIVIRQSIAILEFLEEYFPENPALLPPRNQVAQRAKVRELVNIIACDVQPPTNLRILTRVKRLNGDMTVWAKELMVAGLKAYEALAATCAGDYSVGDEISLADVVLAPAIENALRYGLELDEFPTVERIYKNVKDLDAFRDGDWRHQPDTPEELAK
jgi:maleylacetoacetate isomerase